VSVNQIGWASDAWTADRFTFSIITPFGHIKDPVVMTEEEKKYAFAPVIFAQLTFDNRDKTTDAEMIFGIEGPKRKYTGKISWCSLWKKIWICSSQF